MNYPIFTCKIQVQSFSEMQDWITAHFSPASIQFFPSILTIQFGKSHYNCLSLEMHFTNLVHFVYFTFAGNHKDWNQKYWVDKIQKFHFLQPCRKISRESIRRFKTHRRKIQSTPGRRSERKKDTLGIGNPWTRVMHAFMDRGSGQSSSGKYCAVAQSTGLYKVWKK